MPIKQLEHQETPLQHHQHKLIVVADNVRTPENVGMIFRVAEAFGVERVMFSGEAPNLDNKKVKKTSRSTEKYLKHEFEIDILKTLNELRTAGYYLLGMELTTDSKNIRRFEINRMTKIVLVIGSERHGISAEVLSMLDAAVYIPMRGENSSINVVNALSIGLYEIVSQLETP